MQHMAGQKGVKTKPKTAGGVILMQCSGYFMQREMKIGWQWIERETESRIQVLEKPIATNVNKRKRSRKTLPELPVARKPPETWNYKPAPSSQAARRRAAFTPNRSMALEQIAKTRHLVVDALGTQSVPVGGGIDGNHRLA